MEPEPTMLFPALAGDTATDPGRVVVRTETHALTGAQVRAASLAVARDLPAGRRVLVPVQADAATIVTVVGALLAGCTVVPISARAGEQERAHQVADCDPAIELDPAALDLDAALSGDPHGEPLPPHPDPETPAFVMYTSGTTGPPKGAVLSYRAILANLDALIEVWAWTPDDLLVHALPLYHVHGLILGVLGPLRAGGAVHHLGSFDPGAVADAIDHGATMHFGVPTMYGRLADAAEQDDAIAESLRRARLLVSGSAALPASVRDRLRRTTGHNVLERYGMTETVILTAMRAAERHGTEGSVGAPLPGTEVRLIDDGEVVARGPSLFDGYLNRPDATDAVLSDGWMHTGDVARWNDDGSLSIIGRKATDLIKTGGFRVGAGEVEDALLTHPAVAEAAVRGEPDDELGQRIAAWVVLRDGRTATTAELEQHVAAALSRHKRPRDVYVVADLPRNAMGKVQKARLTTAG